MIGGVGVPEEGVQGVRYAPGHGEARTRDEGAVGPVLGSHWLQSLRSAGDVEPLLSATHFTAYINKPSLSSTYTGCPVTTAIL